MSAGPRILSDNALLGIPNRAVWPSSALPLRGGRAERPARQVCVLLAAGGGKHTETPLRGQGGDQGSSLPGAGQSRLHEDRVIGSEQPSAKRGERPDRKGRLLRITRFLCKEASCTPRPSTCRRLSSYASSGKSAGDGERQRAVALGNRRSLLQVESNDRC